MKDHFSIVEIQETLASLRNIYDVTRLVDPVRSVVLEYPQGCTQPVCEDYVCYAVWNKNHRCENCSSARALRDRKRTSKFEFIEHDIYNVISKYIVVEETPLVLEVVYQVQDDVLLGAFGHNEFVDRILYHNHALYTDELTGSYNRRYLADRPRCPFPVSAGYTNFFAMLDVDNFKAINDQYGHAAGDAALITLAGFLRSQVREREGDCVVRYGGDEFLVLLYQAPEEVAARRMEEILRRIGTLEVPGFPEVRIQSSIGGASQAERPDADDKALIELADQRMYLAKSAGGSRLVLEGSR